MNPSDERQPPPAPARRDDSIAALGEHALVERIRERAGSPPDWLRIGIGDDAAVYVPDRGAMQVITTDGLVEAVHFKPSWTGYRDVGYKAVAVNLSDLAAMGAVPRGVLLALSLPSSFPVASFDALLDGVMDAAREARAALVGGNLARSPGPVVVDVTAIGAVAPRKLLTRSGGRPGDELYVTGEMGAAAAGLRSLEMLSAGGRPPDRSGLDAAALECVARYERPQARVRCGLLVARSRSATAAVDLSDGLAAGVRLLAEASGTGATIDAERIPIHAGAGATADDRLHLALNGGEDYELLFAVPPRRRRAFLAAAAREGRLKLTCIGQLTREPGCWVLRGEERIALGEGFRHF